MDTLQIFISYRRDIDAARAALIEKSIEGGFHGAPSTRPVKVFRDVGQRLGVPWSETLRDQVLRSEVVIPIIGPEWLSASDQYHHRRIDQEDDWVRQELVLALEQHKTVIPVLFDGTPMPPPNALPADLVALAGRLALDVRTANLDNDVQPLLHEILERAEGGNKSAGSSAGSLSEGDSGRRVWPYPDPPLIVKPAQLSDADVELALQQMIPRWTREETPLPQDPRKTRVELARQLQFASFLEVVAFMSEVAEFCDKVNHHPRWENIYRSLSINFSTWDIGHRISHVDLMSAAHIDKVYSRYAERV